MSEFINTVDQFGDDVVFESIVEGTITELKDDVLTNVNQYAFYMRTELKTIDFPSVLTVGISSFQGCSKLTDINLPLVESIGSGAFTNCGVLRVLHLPCVKVLSGSAFSSCKILSDLYLPLVTSVGSYCFSSCYALTYLDFHNKCTIENNAFSSNYDFSTLILRSETMCTLKNVNAFNKCYRMLGTTNNTYNPNGERGYIYVPRALVTSYQSDSVWGSSTLQFRALEDYTVDGTITGELDENKLDPHKLYDPAWVELFNSIDAGTYATDYAVGDTIPLYLGTEGIINMEIVAFDADTLSDGSGKAPISLIAKELLATTHVFNTLKKVQNDDGTYQDGTGTIGGWGSSELRSYMNDTIKSMISENIRSRIKTVTKSQQAFDTSGAKFTQTTKDSLWIPDYSELKYTSGLYYSTHGTKSQRVKNRNGKPSEWWSRHAQENYAMYMVDKDGDLTYGSWLVNDPYGICLGFCL